MIRVILVIIVIGIVVAVLWWERTEKSRKRQVFFSLYNKALAKAKGDKLDGVSISILDVIDETDIGPTAMHILLKKLEEQQYVILSSNTVKLTPQGVAYFKYRYLSEEV